MSGVTGGKTMEEEKVDGSLCGSERRCLECSASNRSFGGFDVGILTDRFDRLIDGVRPVEEEAPAVLSGPGSESLIRFLGLFGVFAA